MRTTIDKAGRVVVPKGMRDELGLAGGAEVEIALVDGRIEIEPIPTPVTLVQDESGYWIARPDRPMPALTQEMVRDVLEQIRR